MRIARTSVVHLPGPLPFPESAKADFAPLVARDFSRRGTAVARSLVPLVILLVPHSFVAADAALPPISTPFIVVERLPEGGIQAQAAVDSKGTVHVVFFKGPPEAGDLYYSHWSAVAGPAAAMGPVRVNSEPHTATAIGSIRTEQIAIGKDDRIHIVWNGIAPKGNKPYAPLYMAYARMNDKGTGFEPQRNLCRWSGYLDGGGSIAADREGNVYALWHTAPPDNKQGEAGRGVFLAISRDNGATFERERMINPVPTGACACCGMRALVDHVGTLRVLYRSASRGGTERDTMLLTSTDKGKSFQLRTLDPWSLNACPMSSFSLADSAGVPVAAWETREQVFWAPLTVDGSPARPASAAPGGVGKSKHPVVLADGRGHLLFAWTEGTGWQRGGAVGWQLYDAGGAPIGPPGHADGLPVWSLLTAYTRPDGAFVILY